jgi:glycosyltransferase involved in cell wall biosynthesis
LDGGEEVARALGVGAKPSLGCCFLVHFGPRGEMHDLVWSESRHGFPQQPGVEDIHLAPERPVCRLVWRLMGDIEDFVSFGQQSIDRMGPDESGTAGDENFHKLAIAISRFLVWLAEFCDCRVAMPIAAKPIVVIAGQTPPPTGGQNVMIARLLDDLRGDVRWCTEHLDFHFTPSFSTVRQANVAKVWELLRVYGRLFRLFFRYGRVDLLIYPSGGPQTVPIVRDIVLLPFVRLVTKRLWIQFHAAGIADRLQGRHGVLERLLRFVYADVDGAIVMTDYNRCDPAALGITEIEVIPHRLKDENRETRLPDFSHKPLRILHAGHLYDLKGTPQLLEAFGQIASEYPEWRLVLMGEFLPPYSEDECRSRCRELGIEQKVDILGVRKGEEKAAQFASSQLFVFASMAPYESFGLVMTEAMMWGLPMLVSNWRGNREVAGDAAEYFETGPLMEKDLGDKMRALLADRGKLLTLSGRSRARFASEFSENGSKYRQLVASLILGTAET